MISLFYELREIPTTKELIKKYLQIQPDDLDMHDMLDELNSEEQQKSWLVGQLFCLVHIFYYVKSKQWWDTIDSLIKPIGKIGLRDGRVDDLMLAWSKDNDFWVRRVAIEHQLLRKNKMNTELLEKILENNLNSSEFFISKAIGWALRDYSKTNPAWVKKFINDHYSDMAALSIKEGSKYLHS